MLDNGTLDEEDLKSKLNEQTRLLAMGYASNAFGTVNNVKKARQLTYQYGSYLLIDAVHYAPHYLMDVAKLGCDLLLCSSYKFYGPHMGILYSKPGLLNTLPTDRLRTTDQQAPFSIETGTLNHAAIAGISAAIKYIASFGSGETIREKLIEAMQSIQTHEKQLASRIYDFLNTKNEVQIYGPPSNGSNRTPTVSFYTPHFTASTICLQLADYSICAWDGHFYALRAIELLGLAEKGGVTRLGISIYNSDEEVDYLIDKLNSILN